MKLNLAGGFRPDCGRRSTTSRAALILAYRVQTAVRRVIGGFRSLPATTSSPECSLNNREPMIERFKRFMRSSLVGLVTSVVDLAIIETGIRLMKIDPAVAKAVALAVCTLIQFFGNRSFAFRAQKGRLGRQMAWFIGCETIAAGLMCLVFRQMVRHMPLEIANALSIGVVYFGFSYPLWKRVFTVLPEDLATAGARDRAVSEPSMAMNRIS